MCVIIDKNTLACVFNNSDSNHHKFKPIFDWIEFGKGRIVYGGSTYAKELADSPGLLGTISQYKKVSKTLKLDYSTVDQIEQQLKLKNPNSRFDDFHIIAIVIASKCKVVCTVDKGLHAEAKKKQHYSKSTNRPNFYTGLSTSGLICNSNEKPCNTLASRKKLSIR